ncbi:hypothetical protein RvVAT039_37720 [Agrobacterium vitis]|uniref:SgcJ/EcaC family oxidoreductase n=3 Tax=Rhizobiaceae TaxID=82115 RepID=A0AAE5ANP5_AGRVI|nr:hypothetical signal peptide protein [Allorhizobium ampelinum S4]MBF2713697.1 SgcJ/EcaC family oxidoreductase [Agrobacterium vitis]MCF1445687.1 SgcJ/EcaC family oxidoreductase [Allorhizobium ampelinum]MCF1460700.1 SgcJ/EcaC family oxidoreductase [Allorhizobium ampelinum]MCF1472147.1 SgcJ/EcaC family oxidoreductase [Allorhizobium ampelinum]
MQKILLAFGVTAGLSVSSFAAPAMAQECAPVTQQQVEKLFDRWNASLATLDPEKVVANYEDDAVLLATLSNQPRLTQEERRAYFVDFLKKKPQGVVDNRTIKLGCNTAIDTGVYTFTLGDGTKVPARYTFTYDYDGGKWLISSHHSSAMPERTS